MTPASSSTRALVIGSGFGGIAAALRLRALGHAVTLLESQPDHGGRARVFRRDGFFYDAGPTVLTAPFLFDELFALFGENRADHIEFLPVKPWYRMIDHEGRAFDYGGSVKDTLREIAKFNPLDQRGYLKLLEKSRRLFETGFTKLAGEPFSSLTDMIRILPDLVRLRGDRTVYDLVCRHLRDPSLRMFFSIQPLLVGGNPFDTSCLYSLIHYLEREWGVWFPRGGTGALVDSLLDLGIRHGVEFRTSTSVKEILIRHGRASGVRLASGETLDAHLVVANADPPTVYRHLIPSSHRRKWTDARLARRHYSMGLFVLYFATNRRYKEVAHHTILFGPRYRELLDDIFNRGILAEDFSLYLHRPTATDPAMAPEGHDTFYVLSPVPNLQHAIDWDLEGPRYAQRILEQLEKTILPDLKKHLVSQFHIAPPYFRDALQTTHGTGFSIAPILTQSAWFRFHNESEDVPGLYFVGAGTHPGAGMPGVLSSAKVVENLLRRAA
jgi:phytoene desaturase